ncbi:unnamed protein product [Effrenium voratum]|uniref:Uncharacterized protein n=1 Tax=Effrenium voratum TaxID=2562239 RepID=A0AA36HMC4_9DINO|nr:unnamed protein product [Effrenium voratum]
MVLCINLSIWRFSPSLRLCIQVSKPVDAKWSNRFRWLCKLLEWLLAIKGGSFRAQYKTTSEGKDNRLIKDSVVLKNGILQNLLNELQNLHVQSETCECGKVKMKCPLCEQLFCGQPNVHREPSMCVVDDVHPIFPDSGDAVQNAASLLRWALQQTLQHVFMRGLLDSRSSHGFQEKKPTLRDWVPSFREHLQFHRKDLTKPADYFEQSRKEDMMFFEQEINTKIKEALTGQRHAVKHLGSDGDMNEFVLNNMRPEGFGHLLSLKYGIRCSTVHGSNSVTLKHVLQSFPTAEELLQALTGVPMVRPQAVSGDIRELLQSQPFWDVFWLDWNGVLNREDRDKISTKDWRHEELKEGGIVLKNRSQIYRFNDPSPTDLGCITVCCASNERDPMTTSKCRLERGGGAESLSFNLHFCYEHELQAKMPHKWMRVALKRTGKPFGDCFTEFESRSDLSELAECSAHVLVGKTGKFTVRSGALDANPEDEDFPLKMYTQAQRWCTGMAQRVN